MPAQKKRQQELSEPLQSVPTGFCVVLFHSCLGPAVTCSLLYRVSPFCLPNCGSSTLPHPHLPWDRVSTEFTEVTLPWSLLYTLVSRRACILGSPVCLHGLLDPATGWIPGAVLSQEKWSFLHSTQGSVCGRVLAPSAHMSWPFDLKCFTQSKRIQISQQWNKASITSKENYTQ